MKYCKVSVSVPGPPLVVAKTYSKTFIASRLRSRMATTKTGANRGSVTRRSTYNPPAPSTRAASSGSLGIDSSPASSSSTMNGVHCHTSMRARVSSALPGPKKSYSMPTLDSIAGIAPSWSLSRNRNVSPTAIGVMNIGASSIDRVRSRAQRCFCSASARASPMTSSRPTATTT